MREIRIKLPDLKDGKRLLSAARDQVEKVDVNDLKKRAGDLVESARGRAKDVRAPDVKIHLLDAHRLVRDTNAKLEEEARLLQEQHDDTAAALAALGEAELAAFDRPVRVFAQLFARIKNVELRDISLEALPDTIRSLEVDVRDVDFSSVDALKTMAAAGGSGATAAVTTLAAVGTLATASTGTAISALSGAAATNATLAWLGGGSLAAGGGGMAAGMAVLGGIVALPVLAVGGLVVHHKGREALAKAREDALRAEEVVKEMELARTMARGIQLRAERVHSLVERLAALADRRNAVLAHLIERNDDYATYDEHDRDAVMVATSVVKTLRTVMDIPVLDEHGTLTTASSDVIDAADEVLAEFDGRPADG